MIFPIYEEIAYIAPHQLFKLWAHEMGAVLLESARMQKNCGRYSFIAIDPFLKLSSKDGKVTVNDHKFSANPWDVLQENLLKYRLQNHPDLPPFQGGTAGFFSYELHQHLESIPLAKTDDMQFEDLMLGFYDVVIAFDQEQKRAWIFSSGFPEKEDARKRRAITRSQTILEKVKNFVAKDKANALTPVKEIQSNFTSAAYQEMVQQVKNYILDGDIFEANLSQRFKAEIKQEDLFTLYQLLCRYNSAPFAAYLSFGKTTLISASPERFLKLCAGEVEARPIKGTSQRHADANIDKQLAENLQRSEKDRAENIMIVDLMRNDLSRVCEDHSVQVPQLCGLETFATVHHLVSVVTGTLKKEYTAIDLLKATFPGGSITGAPKIRAMEIIAELEPTVRGPYCGSIGYIGFNGDMDLSITIRTFAVKDQVIIFQAGGAIVLDSDPLMEYEETLTKSRALKKVLESDTVN